MVGIVFEPRYDLFSEMLYNSNFLTTVSITGGGSWTGCGMHVPSAMSSYKSKDEWYVF